MLFLESQPPTGVIAINFAPPAKGLIIIIYMAYVKSVHTIHIPVSLGVTNEWSKP